MTSLAPLLAATRALDERRAGFEREALVHLDALYRAALRLAGNAADADDLVQETMFKAYHAWDQYQAGSNAKSWLLTILRHAFINEYRRRSARRETLGLDTIERFARMEVERQADPESSYFDGIVDEEIKRAIDALPLPYREVFVLTDIEDLRYEETARILSVPVGTVKSRLFRARKLLQRRLSHYAAAAGVIRGDRSPAVAAASDERTPGPA